MIPRSVLFSDPDKALPKLNPQGNTLSFLAPHQGELNLWLAPIEALAEATPVSSSQNPIQDHWWSARGDYLLYAHDYKGDENSQLYSYEIATGKTRTYTQRGAQARILMISEKTPEKILITLNERDRHYFDVYEVELATGQLNCIYENKTYWSFLAENDLTLRLGIKANEKDGEHVDLLAKEGAHTLAKVSHHDLFALFYFPQLRLGFSKKGDKFYFVQSVNQDTSALMAFDLNTKQTEVLGHDEQADIFDVLLDPIQKIPLAFATHYERKVWRALNAETAADLAFLHKIHSGDISILSQTDDNQQWIIAFAQDDLPTAYYHYQRKLQRCDRLFVSHEAFKNYTFTKMQPCVITMRDGLRCVSYLSLPREKKQPVPLVLWVHGGPNYRDFWGFNPYHQWLTDRGYAVLSVNYRASTGYGKAHEYAGYGEWAGKIQEDLLDAVQWAVDQGITSTEQIAIMGRSFGGYATLAALTLTPTVFCCGVDIVGPANLPTLIKHIPPYWQPLRHLFGAMIGTLPEAPNAQEYLVERSPLTYAQNICQPLLIAHGVNDVRVHQEESDQMVQAMQQNQIPVTYAVFPDEGHQFLHPGNRQAFYGLAEAFLAKNLGGSAEPFDPHTPSSMIVKVDNFNLTIAEALSSG
ncbi:MAG: alpha/beta fold hydrolase [Candidatus Berkiellales bacterium]